MSRSLHGGETWKQGDLDLRLQNNSSVRSSTPGVKDGETATFGGLVTGNRKPIHPGLAKVTKIGCFWYIDLVFPKFVHFWFETFNLDETFQTFSFHACMHESAAGPSKPWNVEEFKFVCCKSQDTTSVVYYLGYQDWIWKRIPTYLGLQHWM